MARKEIKRKDIKISQSTMWNILEGRNVQPCTLGKLTRELGVDITEIMQGENDD